MRDASNLPLRVTAHQSWQLPSDGDLVKSRTLLLEFGIVPDLHHDFCANEVFGGNRAKYTRTRCPLYHMKVRRNNRKCVDVVGRVRNCLLFLIADDKWKLVRGKNILKAVIVSSGWKYTTFHFSLFS